MVQHFYIQLPAFSRGFHLITKHLLEGLPDLPESGLLNVFIQHTSAGLTINENADPDVRVDFENILNNLVPEGETWYTHTLEGDDDMPAHVKSSLMGSSICIPVVKGRLELGVWQGVYLCEFRNRAGGRKLVVSLYQ